MSKGTLEDSAGLPTVGTQYCQTARMTFHVEQCWIEAIRRQADLDGFTYAQIVNKAFRQYFEGE